MKEEFGIWQRLGLVSEELGEASVEDSENGKLCAVGQEL